MCGFDAVSFNVGSFLLNSLQQKSVSLVRASQEIFAWKHLIFTKKK